MCAHRKGIRWVKNQRENPLSLFFDLLLSLSLPHATISFDVSIYIYMSHMCVYTRAPKLMLYNLLKSHSYGGTTCLLVWVVGVCLVCVFVFLLIDWWIIEVDFESGGGAGRVCVWVGCVC